MKAQSEHNHEDCIEHALAQAIVVCERQQQRFTKLRRRVLELVWQSHKPIGAYTLLEQLMHSEGFNEDGSTVETTETNGKLQKKRKPAPPTVYRALEFLSSLGLIHRIASLNAFIGCAEPGHGVSGQFFICSHCSEVFEWHNKTLTNLVIQNANEQGFLVQRQTTEMVGLCYRCKNLDEHELND